MQVVHLLMFNMRESMMCVWGDLVRSICVVGVHDTNMGFKPPCHFVIVHMSSTFVDVDIVELHEMMPYSLGMI